MSTVAETATLAWGYTMADVERLAWASLKRRHFRTLDFEERYATAWHGIVVHLYESPEAPEFHELLTAGLRALNQTLDTELHHHGATYTPEGYQEAPNFTKYWRTSQSDRSDGFSEHLVEVLSLPVALGVLSGTQYEAIVALAAYDNNVGAAAKSLDMKYTTFYNRIQQARERVKEVWFGDETPAQRHKPGDTCRSGHDRAAYGRLSDDGSYWRCVTCMRNAARRRSARGQSRRQVELGLDEAS